VPAAGCDLTLTLLAKSSLSVSLVPRQTADDYSQRRLTLLHLAGTNMNSNSPNLRKHNIRNCVVRLCVFRNYTSIFVIVGSVGMRLGLLWGISFDAATSNRIMTRNSSSPFLPFNSPYFLGRRSALTTGGGGGARRADRLQKQSIFGSSFAFSLSFSLSLSFFLTLSLQDVYINTMAFLSIPRQR
jgi:hypothetical protein